MLDVKALRHAMLDADCTVRELAKCCGVNPCTMHHRLRGDVSFKLREINLIVQRLGLTTEQRNAIFFAGNVS